MDVGRLLTKPTFQHDDWRGASLLKFLIWGSFSTWGIVLWGCYWYLLRSLRLRNLRNASTLLSISGTCAGVEILGVHLRDLRYASTLPSMSRTFTGVVNVGVILSTLRYASPLLSMSGTSAGR